MKKIGIDIRLIGAERTGDEAVFFHLTREILKLDSENEYFLFTHIADPAELAAIQVRLGSVGKKNVTFVSLSGKNRFVWNAWSLPKALSRCKIDIYHTQYIAPFFLPSQVRLVTHIHDISFKIHPEWIGKKDLFFLSLLIPRSLRRSDRILVPSEFTRQELIEHYGISEEKIRVVPNACDAEWLEGMSEDRNDQYQKEKKYS